MAYVSIWVLCVQDDHVESDDDLTHKTKLYFTKAVETWEAAYYLKVDDNIGFGIGETMPPICSLVFWYEFAPSKLLQRLHNLSYLYCAAVSPSSVCCRNVIFASCQCSQYGYNCLWMWMLGVAIYVGIEQTSWWQCLIVTWTSPERMWVAWRLERSSVIRKFTVLIVVPIERTPLLDDGSSF